MLKSIKIVGGFAIGVGVICGPFMLMGLFFSGLIASGVKSATTKTCSGIMFETDCMGKCGCGWCEHTTDNKTVGYCYPIDDNQCSGKFNDDMPESCTETYDNAIIAVIVFGSLSACCLTSVFCGLLIECCAFLCSKKVTVIGSNINNGPSDIESEADL